MNFLLWDEDMKMSYCLYFSVLCEICCGGFENHILYIQDKDVTLSRE